MNFHTISKSIDCRKPSQSREYQAMLTKTNKRLNKFVKHKVEVSGKSLDDLSHQQAFDVLEAFAYTKKGHSNTMYNILSLVKH